MARTLAALKPMSEVWEWQLLGRCRDRASTQFFHPDDDLGRISRRLREAAAKRLCSDCPVRRECATHALSVGEEYGVWGGFSETDRMLLRDIGWRDTLDRGRLADVDRLQRRLDRARATQAMPKEAMPKEAMPKEAMPKEAMPKEAMAKEAMAGQSMAPKATQSTATQSTATQSIAEAPAATPLPRPRAGAARQHA